MITSAGVELNDVGGSLSWGAFASFIKNLGYDSAVFRAQHPDMAEWGSTLKTNIILADIFDVLCQINANMVGGLSHKRPQRPKPYPRPWVDKKKKTGKGALPVSELEKWIEQKRNEPRRRKDGKH